MRKTLRLVISSLLLLLAGVLSAPAQSFEIVANQSDLAPSSGEADAHCLVQASNGTLVFFNSAVGAIYAWDGSTLTEHTAPSTLNNRISAGGDINRCDAVAIDGNDFVYFSFRSTSDNVNHIYRTDVADASTFSTTEVNGINGLTVDGSTLYLAGVADFGATGNGIFEMSSDLSGDTTAVAKNSNIDLGDASLGVDSNGIVYGWSTGSSNFEEVVVSVDPSATSPAFNAFVDPYASGVLTKSDDLIVDLDVIEFEGAEYVVVYNASFGPGEEWGTIQISDQSVSLLFAQSDLVDNSSAEGYTGGFTEPMAVNSSGEVFMASRDGFGASDYIARGSDAAPLPVELTSFDAVQTGSSVELTWQTASETNNAGFRVQHETDTGTWAKLGFVQSKASGGTTTDPEGVRNYRFAVDRELEAGTHRFRLEQVDLDGSTHLSTVVEVDVQLNRALNLSAPAPNPASGQTSLSFAVKTEAEASVAVYNVLGQKVTTLYRGTPETGTANTITFDTGSLPSGVYLVRIQAAGQTKTQRLTVVR